MDAGSQARWPPPCETAERTAAIIRAVPLPIELSHKDYEEEIERLQTELVFMQEWIVAKQRRLVVLFEGRDTAGKDGVLRRITAPLNPRTCRIVAVPTPTEREQTQWFFQRYVAHLPAAGEIVLFDRSWYNRAGVERVMGFCSKSETREFLEVVPDFEGMLVRSGIRLFKYYLDITHHEQKKRLKSRAHDPLKQWKLSPIDMKALKLWNDYSKARNQMLTRTHTAMAPWSIVRADDKDHARLNVIRDLLHRLDYKGRSKRLVSPDSDIVFPFEPGQIENGMIAP